MDQRLIDHFDGDVTQANINPRKREKILARYGGGTGTAGGTGTSVAGAAS
jgi:alkane 1-monooxygenase